MKLLILYATTGGGHGSAARAIKNAAESKGHICDIKNYFDFMPKASADLLSNGHDLLYRYLPKMYEQGYDLMENIGGIPYMVQNGQYGARVGRYVEKHGYDAVICVHTFPAAALTHLKTRYQWKNHCYPFKQYFVATDYDCSPGVEKYWMDGWFVPRGTKKIFSEKGIPIELIHDTGIPISDAFYDYDSNRKMSARETLGISLDKKVLLVACGSMGAGPLADMALRLRAQAPDDALIAVVCGTNKRLLATLSAYGENNKFQPLGYIDNMATWMKAADVYITKPGGLSSTEAVALQVPLVFINAVPGLETKNLKFMVDAGCALTGETNEDICTRALELLADESACVTMTRAQADTIRTRSAEEIVKRVEEDFQ